jgi:hypothetical protein
VLFRKDFDMREHWPELLKLAGKEVSASGRKWVIRHSDVLEDQRSSRLALLLDLETDHDVVSARLLFPAETLSESDDQTKWILESLKRIIESGRLRQQGIYSIA